MNTARHAGQILKAWSLADSGCLEAELQTALTLCEGEASASELESEQQAVLQSVVQLFCRNSQQAENGTAPPQLEAGLFLLRHLQSRAA